MKDNGEIEVSPPVPAGDGLALSCGSVVSLLPPPSPPPPLPSFLVAVEPNVKCVTLAVSSAQLWGTERRTAVHLSPRAPAGLCLVTHGLPCPSPWLPVHSRSLGTR